MKFITKNYRIRFRRVYIFPTLVVYVPNELLKHYTGYCLGPIVVLRESASDIDGWEVHELTHVAQFWRTLGLHALFYYINSKYRIDCEKEAYYNQLHHSTNPGLTPHTASFTIAMKYGWNFTFEERLELERFLISGE